MYPDVHPIADPLEHPSTEQVGHVAHDIVLDHPMGEVKTDDAIMDHPVEGAES